MYYTVFLHMYYMCVKMCITGVLHIIHVYELHTCVIHPKTDMYYICITHVTHVAHFYIPKNYIQGYVFFILKYKCSHENLHQNQTV